jgi:hypothetical protein
MRQTAADFRRSGDELPAWVTLPHSHACVVLRGAPFAVTFGMDRPSPEDAARLVVEERFAGALVAILAGSVAMGRATATSDLDLIVLAPDDPDVPYRESFSAHGWPVEAFIHDERSIEGFFRHDARTGECALATMISTGIVIRDDGSADRLRRRAQSVIDAGPPAVSEDEVRDLRYTVTDLLDDLRGDHDGDESLLIAPSLAAGAATLFLTINGAWRSEEKWLLRRLRDTDPAVADRFVLALRAHQRGDAEPLIAFAEEILDSSGGPLFEGYRASGAPLIAGLEVPEGGTPGD